MDEASVMRAQDAEKGANAETDDDAICSPCLRYAERRARILDKGQQTVNTTRWVRVALPFRPFKITTVKDAMWVCGTNEMIAVSKDGGVSWHMQHQKRDGEILTNIAFANSMIGHASATNGLLLSTSDGGQTWSSQLTSGTIRQFSFADLTNGIADLDGVLKVTSDGGKQWRDLAVLRRR